MACNHSDKALWIGRADGIYCKECGAKIDPAKKAAPVKKAEPAAAPVKKAEPVAEPEKKAPAKKAPVKKTTAGRAKK